MKPLPSLFLAHGAPDLPLSQHPAKQFLSRLGSLLPRPRGIVIISAHWEAQITTIGSASHPETVHDFSGWPAELYGLKYSARTDAMLIDEISLHLAAAGIESQRDPTRGYDHGGWVPLSLIYPEADIPVVQVSLSRGKTPRFHLQLGQALAPLREQGILIIGSGATVHNLGTLAVEGSSAPVWALAFENWLHDALIAKDIDELLAFPKRPRAARQAHPTDEHLMPIFVSLGAGLSESRITRLHQSFSYGSIGMTCYAFGSVKKRKNGGENW